MVDIELPRSYHRVLAPQHWYLVTHPTSRLDDAAALDLPHSSSTPTLALNRPSNLLGASIRDILSSLWDLE